MAKMTRKKMKGMIPQGYCKVIAQKAGVSRKSVSDFLHGRTDSHKVEMAALEVIADLTRQKAILIRDIL
ncbi:MAG: hypothetical protein KF856_14255 [Cyclobacteriaceae bacterium]|nr:hypothetical protein [Cyclobacteriaceae bacterium]